MLKGLNLVPFGSVPCFQKNRISYECWNVRTGPLAPLALYPKTRYVGLGLVIHMVLDSLACQMNLGIWFV